MHIIGKYYLDKVKDEGSEYIKRGHIQEQSEYIDGVINEENEIINEDAMLIAGSILMTIIFGQEIADKIKKIKADKKYTYIVSDKEIKKIPNYGFEDEKIALSWYAYDHLGIKNAEKGTLLYNSKSVLNKNVYLYKFNKSNIKLVYNGPFDELCEKYNIKMKPMNESKLKDRDKIYKQTLSLVKQELNKYKELKSKARLEPNREEYYDKFINGIDDSIGILYCDIWDIVPNARSNYDKDVEHTNKIAYEPIQNIIKAVNTKLPKDYKVDSYGDWDDLDISLTYTGKLNESYTPYKGGSKVNKINNLAKIARQYGISESGNLRADIVSEYSDIIESLDTIDESVIVKDISLLPVYKINESMLEESEYIEEGYAIDLDSLKYVIESKHITLEETIQEIRDVNYIGDTIPMYCVLPENINENMSLESFIELNDILNESEITPIAITELSRKDWKDIGNEYKYEDRYRFSQTFKNMGDIIKNMFDNPTKSGNFEKIRPRLLKMVDRCETLEDVNYLKRDARAGKVQLTKLKQNKPEIAKQIDSHLKWIDTDYMKALNDKAKEIKSKK